MRNRIDLGVFWNTFEQILIENGEPFKIVYKDHYADPLSEILSKLA